MEEKGLMEFGDSHARGLGGHGTVTRTRSSTDSSNPTTLNSSTEF